MSFGPAQWGFDESLADHAASGQYWGGRYSLNGKAESLPKEKYLPDLTHDFVVDFIKRQEKTVLYLLSDDPHSYSDPTHSRQHPRHQSGSALLR